MNRRIILFVFAAFLLFAPLAAFAAETSFFGPIISDACTCPGKAPGLGCVFESIRLALNFAITLACVIAALIIAYAGFLFMGSATNPEMKSRARNVLINALIGLVIALAGWLIVDFVMAKLYNPDAFGLPWYSILKSGDMCVEPQTLNELYQGAPLGSIPSGTGSVPPAAGGTSKPSAPANVAGKFTFQSGVAAEQGAESGALSSLLSCMATKVPAGVGNISALTDKYSGTNATLIAHCAAVGHKGDSQCAHAANSCHYGGRSCVGSAYAVDFGDEQNADALRSAARSCDPGARWNYEGNHVHISVGAQSGCGCDTTMGGV